MKIDSTPQAIVVCVGIVAAAGLVVALAFAGWSTEAIIAFTGLIVATVTGQYVSTRQASEVKAKTAEQTAMISTVLEQTNGMSHTERQDIAERAAAAAIRKMGERP